MRVLATALGIVGLTAVGLLWVSDTLDGSSKALGPEAASVASQAPTGNAGASSRGAPSLGGGYKVATWGMSAVQVARAIGKPEFWSVEDLAYRDNQTMEEFLGIIGDNEKRLYWRFYKDRFYEVEIYPLMKGEDSDGTAFGLLVSKLQEKFGEGQLVRPKDPADTKCMEWDDGETRIDLLKWDHSSLLETLTIVYTSKKIERQIEMDRKAAREQAKTKEKARVQSALDQL
jgi:hypothetical protein